MTELVHLEQIKMKIILYVVMIVPYTSVKLLVGQPVCIIV